MYNNIELLAPAGSAAALKAAVQSGADAVYTGGRLFSARQGADNFSFEELCEYVRYCHLYGVKVHVALNTLIKEKELPLLTEYVAELGKAGVDALIVQDMGAVQLIKKILPDTELHASTQMTVTTLDGVRFLEKNGFARVVLARELSRENIKHICNNAKAEIEVFGHGALCICYSGQCLMSSVIGGRSGNRGRCAQPCRLPYSLEENGKKVRSGYLMSPKDLCLVENLDELSEIGVASLKIEGRLKRPEYVAAVVGVYRKYLDKPSKVSKADMTELLNAFNRGGFSGAYFTGDTGEKMMSIEKPGNDASNSFADDVVKRCADNANVRKISINMFFSAEKGHKISLTVWDNDGNSVTKEGTQKVEAANNKPTTIERIKEQLSKTGSTPYTVDECTVECGEGLIIPISELNSLRRSVLEELSEKRMEASQKQVYSVSLEKKSNRKDKNAEDIKLFAEIHTAEQLEAVMKNGIDGVYVPLELYDVAVKNNNGITKIILKMPDVTRDDFEYNIPETDDIMITHFGQLEQLAESGKRLYGDFRLNVYNSYTADFYSSLERITISPELNIHEIRDAVNNITGNTEIIAYGRLPLMITQNCPAKQYKCSNHKQKYSLKDRIGESFPLICGMGCYSKIVNSKPVYMADKIKDIKNLQIFSIRLIFTVENFAECDKIINVYKSAMSSGNVCGIADEVEGAGNYTRGHFYRGVQ